MNVNENKTYPRYSWHGDHSKRCLWRKIFHFIYILLCAIRINIKTAEKDFHSNSFWFVDWKMVWVAANQIYIAIFFHSFVVRAKWARAIMKKKASGFLHCSHSILTSEKKIEMTKHWKCLRGTSQRFFLGRMQIYVFSASALSLFLLYLCHSCSAAHFVHFD